MRSYPSPRFSLYREALNILVASLCDDTHPSDSLYIGKPQRSLWLAYAKIPIPLLLSISGRPKDPCGWHMRRYPSPCFSLYREVLKDLVAALCEDTHPLLLSI